MADGAGLFDLLRSSIPAPGSGLRVPNPQAGSALVPTDPLLEMQRVAAAQRIAGARPTPPSTTAIPLPPVQTSQALVRVPPQAMNPRLEALRRLATLVNLAESGPALAMLPVAIADDNTNYGRIKYTGSFGGPSFATNPYASGGNIVLNKRGVPQEVKPSKGMSYSEYAESQRKQNASAQSAPQSTQPRTQQQGRPSGSQRATPQVEPQSSQMNAQDLLALPQPFTPGMQNVIDRVTGMNIGYDVQDLLGNRLRAGMGNSPTRSSAQPSVGATSPTTRVTSPRQPTQSQGNVRAVAPTRFPNVSGKVPSGDWYVNDVGDETRDDIGAFGRTALGNLPEDTWVWTSPTTQNKYNEKDDSWSRRTVGGKSTTNKPSKPNTVQGQPQKQGSLRTVSPAQASNKATATQETSPRITQAEKPSATQKSTPVAKAEPSGEALSYFRKNKQSAGWDALGTAVSLVQRSLSPDKGGLKSRAEYDRLLRGSENFKKLDGDEQQRVRQAFAQWMNEQTIFKGKA